MWPRRGADLARRKFRVFCARRVVLVPVVARALNSAHHESSHASGAVDTAENDSKRVFLTDSLRKTAQ